MRAGQLFQHVSAIQAWDDLERIKKYCSHSDFESEDAVFLVFGVVSAQSQGFANLLLRQSLAKTQKSSRRIGYSIFLTALEHFK